MIPPANLVRVAGESRIIRGFRRILAARGEMAVMWMFAWRNLMTRPLRTALALVGLSIPILGVLGLYGISGGLRNLVGSTLNKIQGVVVLREDCLSPVFSDMPMSVADQLRSIPGIQAVAPELWKQAPRIDNRGAMGLADLARAASGDVKAQQSLLDKPLILGQDIPSHIPLKTHLFPKALVAGRFLVPSDRGQPNIVISKKVAHDFRLGKNGPDRKVGDTLKIGPKTFHIVGMYSTGSMLLDVAILMDIDTARNLLGVSPTQCSSCYVEMTDPSKNLQMAETIRVKVPGYEARPMERILSDFANIMGQVESFLLMTVLLALVVGVVGIVNTMLMSTYERYAEFGVLRTNGWSRADVLGLVTRESAFLGLMSGILGCLLAWLGATLANQFLGGGLQLIITPRLVALGLFLSLGMGTLGGLIPAWRASRLVPMDAIRLGAR